MMITRREFHVDVLATNPLPTYEDFVSVLVTYKSVILTKKLWTTTKNQFIYDGNLFVTLIL